MLGLRRFALGRRSVLLRPIDVACIPTLVAAAMSYSSKRRIGTTTNFAAEEYTVDAADDGLTGRHSEGVGGDAFGANPTLDVGAVFDEKAAEAVFLSDEELQSCGEAETPAASAAPASFANPFPQFSPTAGMTPGEACNFEARKRARRLEAETIDRQVFRPTRAVTALGLHVQKAETMLSVEVTMLRNPPLTYEAKAYLNITRSIRVELARMASRDATIAEADAKMAAVAVLASKRVKEAKEFALAAQARYERVTDTSRTAATSKEDEMSAVALPSLPAVELPLDMCTTPQRFVDPAREALDALLTPNVGPQWLEAEASLNSLGDCTLIATVRPVHEPGSSSNSGDVDPQHIQFQSTSQLQWKSPALDHATEPVIRRGMAHHGHHSIWKAIQRHVEMLSPRIEEAEEAPLRDLVLEVNLTAAACHKLVTYRIDQHEGGARIHVSQLANPLAERSAAFDDPLRVAHTKATQEQNGRTSVATSRTFDSKRHSDAVRDAMAYVQTLRPSYERSRRSGPQEVLWRLDEALCGDAAKRDSGTPRAAAFASCAADRWDIHVELQRAPRSTATNHGSMGSSLPCEITDGGVSCTLRRDDTGAVVGSAVCAASAPEALVAAAANCVATMMPPSEAPAALRRLNDALLLGGFPRLTTPHPVEWPHTQELTAVAGSHVPPDALVNYHLETLKDASRVILDVMAMPTERLSVAAGWSAPSTGAAAGADTSSSALQRTRRPLLISVKPRPTTVPATAAAAAISPLITIETVFLALRRITALAQAQGLIANAGGGSGEGAATAQLFSVAVAGEALEASLQPYWGAIHVDATGVLAVSVKHDLALFRAAAVSVTIDPALLHCRLISRDVAENAVRAAAGEQSASPPAEGVSSTVMTARVAALCTAVGYATMAPSMAALWIGAQCGAASIVARSVLKPTLPARPARPAVARLHAVKRVQMLMPSWAGVSRERHPALFAAILRIHGIASHHTAAGKTTAEAPATTGPAEAQTTTGSSAWRATTHFPADAFDSLEALRGRALQRISADPTLFEVDLSDGALVRAERLHGQRLIPALQAAFASADPRRTRGRSAAAAERNRGLVEQLLASRQRGVDAAAGHRWRCDRGGGAPVAGAHTGAASGSGPDRSGC
jgi:hypothetical protein